MIKFQLYKGCISTLLLILLERHGKMYGYEIVVKVKEMTQGDLNITEGALYPALHKLKEEGFLQDENYFVDGRLRKYYELTMQGEKEVLIRIEELSNFIRNLQQFI
ncbi:PadR family transcriptional regulator [Capnocytophaga sp. ARDL2]|uniref:PadR family transcriptional regulator n=1 Tax=Capnocytophaga sp. ARDL2 TaxID=3238809 RepID=UPI0035567B69